MSRRTAPAHIAALDEALEAAIARSEEADANLAAVLDQHIAAYTVADRAIDEAATARSTAYGDIRNCQRAIEKLGYCQVVKVPEKPPYNLQDDMAAARKRRGIEAGGPGAV